MIVIMKRGTPQKEIDSLTDALIAKGVEVNPVIGKDLIILGLVGDTSKIEIGRASCRERVFRMV